MRRKLLSLFDEGVIKHEKLLKSTTECLNNAFDINYFSYQKIGLDGNYVLLANNTNYIEYYINNQLYKYDIFVHDPRLCHNNKQFFVLKSDSDENNQDLDILFSHCRPTFNINQCIIVRLKHTDYYELFCFGTNQQKSFIENLYLNHMSAIQKFIPYFKSSLSKVIYELEDMSLNIQEIKGEKFSINNTLESIVGNKHDNFLNAIHDEAFEWQKKFTRLSSREIACLHLITQGKTAKESASILNLSTRTIEEYRENARKKLAPDLKLNRVCYLLGKYSILQEN